MIVIKLSTLFNNTSVLLLSGLTIGESAIITFGSLIVVLSLMILL